jgi:2'-5' RNA ligase
MECELNGNQRLNCYALVTYIPDPLGRFLDDLRKELVPGSNPHAHVTLMPPRPLQSEQLAWEQIVDFTAHLPAFDLQIANLAIFPKTNVIYLEIGVGRDQLLAIHQGMNQGPLQFTEPFPYHPHITLAQELGPEAVPAAAETARLRWKDFRDDRWFAVDRLAFVQNSESNIWTDLGTVQLVRQPVPVRR